MKITDTQILLTLEQMYGYHSSSGEWLPMKQINRLKNIGKTSRIGIWGEGENNEKMYFQINKSLFNQLVEQGIFKHSLEIE